MPSIPQRHAIVIVGGGSGGISAAARLRRAGARDVAIIDPWPMHYYQPLWTLVGAGLAQQSRSARPRESVIPKGVSWIRRGAVGVDPVRRTVQLDDGAEVEYGQLLMANGIQLDWDKVDGLREAVGHNGLSSNYRFDLAPKMWDFIRSTRSGTAVFTMPTGAIKCAGAPQKIAYLAADYWRQEGVLDKIDIHLVLPGAAMFGIKAFSDILDRVVQRYGITVHFESELVAVDGASRLATIKSVTSGETTTLGYDVMHATPPQSAPDWVKASPLAGAEDPAGYVEVDKHTLQHVRYPEVFAIGDVGSTPNSKTGAAVRHQAPTVAGNMRDVAQGTTPSHSYDGYASCPLTTSRSHMLLAEFDYSNQPAPSIPILDTVHEHKDFGLLKKVGLPTLYWNFMLKGLA